MGSLRLTVDEVADGLRVSPRRVHALVRSGQLACIQVSARIRVFSEDQIRSFEEAKTIATCPVPPVKSVDRPATRLILSRATSSNTRRERGERKHGAVAGVESNTGNSNRAQILEEMRQWR